MNRIKHNKSEAGFSLLEVVVAFSFFAVMFVALMGTVASSYANVMNSGDRAVAIKEAQIVINNMRRQRDLGAAVPAGMVALFPQGPLNPPRNTLPNEVVTITHANAAATPLFVTVQVQWNAGDGRVRTEQLSTIISGL